jgi:hypothetical protein
VNAAASPQTPAPDYNRPEFPANPAVAAPPILETNGGEGMVPAEQGPGIGPTAAFHRVAAGMGSTSVRSRQPSVRSPDLSDRLTRIARAKGMLSGEGIDVYLSNSGAILRGTVRAPGNSVLLANLLALEPEVQQIDNQLVVEGTGTPSSARTGR